MAQVRGALAWILRSWPVVVPTVLALICIRLRGVVGLPDTAWYLVAALNLLQGHGLVDTDGSPIVVRGPLFPGLISVAFSLLGTSVLHALWVVRAFFVASIALISWLGFRLSSAWAGLAAGLLALTAVRIQEWYAVILLDGVLSAMLLLTIALVYEASVAERPLRWYAAAGVSLGVAFLTKEGALVLLPLPLLVGVLSGRRRGAYLPGSVVYVLASLFVVLPWAIHVFDSTGSFRWLLGTGEQVASRAVASGGGGGLLVIVGQYLGMIQPYYSRYLAAHFPLAPLWIVSWTYAGLRGCVKPAPTRAVLLGSALLFSPIALVTAKNGLRAGQTLLLYQLSCVALAILLSDAATWLGPRFSKGRQPGAATGICATALLLAALVPQVFLDKEFKTWVRGRPVGHGLGLSFSSKARFARKGWVARHIERAAQSIRDKVPPGAVIMSDWHWRTSLYFFSQGAHTFIRIPYLSTPLSTPQEWPAKRYSDLALPKGEKPLFVFTRRDSSDDLDTSLLVLSQSVVLAEMDKWNANWVVVTHRRPFLGLFFDEHPGFTKRLSLSGGRIRLYERTGREPFTSFEMHVGSQTARWLEAMREERPTTAAEIERFLMEQGGLTEPDLARLREGGFEKVTTSPGY